MVFNTFSDFNKLVINFKDIKPILLQYNLKRLKCKSLSSNEEFKKLIKSLFVIFISFNSSKKLK